ncbi:MAG: response regulator [Candidatus Staskawiczbacteria bacterium]|jgi:adenine C2-methylase RlmN of 23S rRNA A2503 and tRNA A37
MATDANPGPIKVLVLDDHPVSLAGLKACLRENFDVYGTTNTETANKLMATSRFDCALIDVNLNLGVQGFEVARWYRRVDPDMAIILITSEPSIYRLKPEVTAIADDCIDKSFDDSVLHEAISNAVWNKQKPHKQRQKQFAVMQSLLPRQKAIRLFNRVGGGAERLEGLLEEDGASIVWDVYNIRGKNETRNVIGIASAVGCAGRCEFCQSRKRPFVRKLSVNELIAQVLYGMESYHARGAFEGLKTLVINFTTEGDCIFSNLDNSCRAVELLAQLEGVDLSFIMTTIGHEKNLQLFFEKYIHLPITFYWSLNSLNPGLRERLMPATTGHSLIGLRDIFQKITEKTGRITTVSWILMKGLNDSASDVESLKAFFGQRPFEIKLMALEKGSLNDVPDTTSDDVERFADLLQKAKLAYRIRKIVGGDIKAGCGTTIPNDVCELRSYCK